MKPYRLILKQTNEKLSLWMPLLQQARPKKGWVRVIRTALGMTTTVLAARLGVNQSRVFQLEKAEGNDAVTLKSLRQAAHALDCELVYAIVPRTSLNDILETQAKKLAKQTLESVAHSMRLEAQETSAEQQKQQLESLIEELLEEPPKKLWKKYECSPLLPDCSVR